MAVIGWIYIIAGVGAILVAMIALLRRDVRAVRFPKWIRVGYYLMISLMLFSFSGLFFKPLNGALICFRVGASLFALIVVIGAIVLSAYKIEIRKDDFVVRTLFSRKAYGYDEITAASGEIARGIIAIEITVGGRKIALNKMMQGYDLFYDKLADQKVFMRFPII
ncbi:MAG: hypothetical protein J1F36_03405 [Clostridiales bacterium]|nr:hypothetical protein [Clostridiales bacterium]